MLKSNKKAMGQSNLKGFSLRLIQQLAGPEDCSGLPG
jgi:hypothetical protein